MQKKLLNLVPYRFLCPFCGKWHFWCDDSLKEYRAGDGKESIVTLYCDKQAEHYGLSERAYVKLWLEGENCTLIVDPCCNSAKEKEFHIPISEIKEDQEKCQIIFEVPFYSEYDICVDGGFCKRCKCPANGECQLPSLTANSDDCRYIPIRLIIGYDEDEYKKEIKSTQLENKEAGREKGITSSQLEVDKTEQEETSDNTQLQDKFEKEDFAMGEITNKNSILTQLYEKSPKENLEIVRTFAKKYEPALKWVIPVAAIYGAYRILNSDEFDLSVNNIADTCEKKIGFKMEPLQDKKALKELMVLGGLSAGAYGAVKAFSAIFGDKEAKDISAEDVEAGMDQLDSISKKFAWIQPKTENLLPIAFSVIFVYVALHRPQFTGKFADKVRNLTEDFQIKMSTYTELAKYFIQDKFNLDLSDEEEQKKVKICALLVAMIGIFAFLYGKKVLGGDKENTGESEYADTKSVEAFVEQAKLVIKKVAPTVYTTLITLLASKKILMLSEYEEEVASEEEEEQD